GLTLIVLIVLVNLRGVRESGTIFAAPTYLFVASFLMMIGVGLVRAALNGGIFHAIAPVPFPSGTDFRPTEQLSFFLILTAFASGCSAMTGVEAISNGVPIFKPRQEKNAAQTLTIMAVLLGVMYAGTTYLAWRYGMVPNQEQNPTLIAQMAHLFFTGWFGWFFYVFQIATTLILVLAANTSFSDFPRLSSILARDQFLPHVFGMQGDRLAFNTGIIVLGVCSSILLSIFAGNTDALINLYAIGVFAAFTMSQLGMVRRWLRRREPGWHVGLPINALGAVVTAIVTAIIAISKFDHGAWVVVILIPIIYIVFRAIHRHYARIKQSVASILVRRPGELRHIMVVPIASLDNLARRGLAYARSLTPLVIAVHIAMDDQDAAATTQQWHDLLKQEHFLRGGPVAEDNAPEEDDVSLHKEDIAGPELVIIDSPYRALTRPILNYIDMLQRKYPNDIITVVLPEFVVTNVWEALLHNQTAFVLKWRLLGRPQIATTNVPYHFMHEHAA
ncbi:MAG TPA: APC family permease, partial [Ktedonobacterales bacterium]|nr:APC family permease [Ktedonobacterales bacterium]